MRSIWKGNIRFGLVTIPVRLYSAVDSSETIRFNQLHKEDNSPIGYTKQCKACEKVLPNDEIVKGFQYEKDRYVIVDKEDFDKVKVKSTKIIEIEGFVDSSEVHPTLYDTPYYAGPDGVVAAQNYALLCKALNDSGKMGIGRVVMRDREDMVMICPQEQGIILYKLRNKKKIRPMADVPDLEDQEIREDFLAVAHQLIEMHTTTLDDLDFTDRYTHALRDMIQAKIAGEEVVVAPDEASEPVEDVMALLKQSLANAKKQMVKSKPSKKPAAKKAKKPAKKRARKAKKVA